MSIVISLSGKKGSGKNTISDFILEYYTEYYADKLGTDNIFYKGSDSVFYAFADPLKRFCIEVLGLSYNQCYGSEEDKETLTEYRWENTPLKHTKEGRMKARDVLQIFGTESVRNWFGNVWAKATLRAIEKDNPSIAIITDNRFPDETETVLGHPHGYIIRLTRSIKADQHYSETALDEFDWDRDRCFILDNARMSKSQQNTKIVPILKTIFSGELD